VLRINGDTHMHMIDVLKATLTTFIILGSMGFADGSDELTVTADLPVIFDLTPPSPMTWNLTVGPNEFHDSDYFIYLVTNCREPWSLYVSSDRAKMTSESTSADTLANGLTMAVTGLGNNEDLLLTTEPQKLLSSSLNIANQLWINLKQEIVLTDKPHDDYKMAITITAAED